MEMFISSAHFSIMINGASETFFFILVHNTLFEVIQSGMILKRMKDWPLIVIAVQVCRVAKFHLKIVLHRGKGKIILLLLMKMIAFLYMISSIMHQIVNCIIEPNAITCT